MGVEAPERVFQQQVVATAEALGWRVAHFHDSRRQVRRTDGSTRTIGDKSAAGFPDLVMVKERRLIFAELKREKGRLTEAQRDWLWALEHVRVGLPGGWDFPPETYVWRPSMWPEIDRILKGLPAKVAA